MSHLVLSRKLQQSVQIGDAITVTIERIGPTTVRLGITAPESMNIVRMELQQPSRIVDAYREHSRGEELLDDDDLLTACRKMTSDQRAQQPEGTD